MGFFLVDNELFEDFDTIDNSLTAAQKAFFKNSKCRYANGNLIKVYRADDTAFTIFDPSFINTNEKGGIIFGKGFYFGSEYSDIEDYGEQIRTFYLNLNNPFIWKPFDAEKNVKAFIKVLRKNKFPVTSELYDRMIYDVEKDDGGLDTLIEMTCGENKAQDYFINAGFDGIINFEVEDFVAFYPNQIKLSTNENPTSSNDITK